jgi:hypothetical protein
MTLTMKYRDKSSVRTGQRREACGELEPAASILQKIQRSYAGAIIAAASH